MEVKIFENPAQIGEAVGKIFVNQINASPDCVLGLATGATPIPTYNYICNAYKNGEVSLKNIKTFNLDEYCDLPVEDVNSYYSFMHENLFNHTDVLEENVHFLNGNAEDDKAECAKYVDMIKEAGGIDLQLLGIGTNGHIGFNEPSDEFSKGPFKVKLTDSTITSNSIYFTENPMPHYALTMGIEDIMAAKKVILIATGESKAKAVLAMIKGEVTPRCPASILQKHNNVLIFLDKAAASLL